MSVDKFLASNAGRHSRNCTSLGEETGPAMYTLDPLAMSGMWFMGLVEFVDGALMRVQLFYTYYTKPASRLDKFIFFFLPLRIPSREESLRALCSWMISETGQQTAEAVYKWGTVSIVDDRVREGTYIDIVYKYQ